MNERLTLPCTLRRTIVRTAVARTAGRARNGTTTSA